MPELRQELLALRWAKPAARPASVNWSEVEVPPPGTGSPSWSLRCHPAGTASRASPVGLAGPRKCSPATSGRMPTGCTWHRCPVEAAAVEES